MPNSDGKGPAGAGPKTGKGKGPCVEGAPNAPVQNQKPGRGAGKGNRHGNGHGNGMGAANKPASGGKEA